VFGLKRTYKFVFQKDNLRATALTMGGIFIVLLGRPVIGMCVEILGFSLLHRCVLVLHLRVRVMTAHFLPNSTMKIPPIVRAVALKLSF
jgi:hypothetical protein